MKDGKAADLYRKSAGNLILLISNTTGVQFIEPACNGPPGFHGCCTMRLCQLSVKVSNNNHVLYLSNAMENRLKGRIFSMQISKYFLKKTSEKNLEN